MSKTLTSNVFVDGRWYGPDYPQNKATAEVLDQISNPAAFADPDDAEVGYGDNRVRKDDFAVADDDEAPVLRSNEAPSVAESGEEKGEAKPKQQQRRSAPEG